MSPSARRPPSDDLEGRLDRLFALPLDRFVQERNALAAALRKEGRDGDASRVKALTRPTLPAWALNQVYWHARREYDRLTAAGDRLRELQRQALAGRKVALDEPTRDRQEAIRGVVERAAALMSEAGQTVTEATRQRIAASADAIASYGSRPDAYVPGRLERELEPPGFAALADLAASPGLRLIKSDRDEARAPAARKPDSKTAGGTREEAKVRAAEAREAERQRRQALKDAKQDRDARERAVEAARRAESAASARVATLRRDADALRRQLSEADDEVRRAEEDAAKARRQLEAAQEERRRAAERIRELGEE